MSTGQRDSARVTLELLQNPARLNQIGPALPLYMHLIGIARFETGEGTIAIDCYAAAAGIGRTAAKKHRAHLEAIGAVTFTRHRNHVAFRITDFVSGTGADRVDAGAWVPVEKKPIDLAARRSEKRPSQKAEGRKSDLLSVSEGRKSDLYTPQSTTPQSTVVVADPEPTPTPLFAATPPRPQAGKKSAPPAPSTPLTAGALFEVVPDPADVIDKLLIAQGKDWYGVAQAASRKRAVAGAVAVGVTPQRIADLIAEGLDMWGVLNIARKHPTGAPSATVARRQRSNTNAATRDQHRADIEKHNAKHAPDLFGDV